MKKLFFINKSLLYFLALSLVLTACNSNSDKSEEEVKKTVDTEEEGTTKMVKLLSEVHGQIDPMKVGYFLNSSRAENYKSLIGTSQTLNEQLQANAQYAYELINAGRSADAIVEIHGLIEKFKQSGVDTKSTYGLYRLLALAYMRLGEQDNCIGNNNSESCIIPIQGKGVYTLKQGSETAIQIYEDMLKVNPEDLESVWMMNIAYMTLGQYPDKVPEQWRIPLSAFDSDYQIPPFKNIANQLNISTVGLSGGSCVDDFDNDGFLDIVASSWGVYDQLKIFLSNGDGTFRDHTENSGIKGITGGLNINHADYNNDGFKDILVLRGAWFADSGKMPNSLLKNNGDGTFSDVTFECGLLSQYPTQAATWNDFNNDGWLDLFIGNESSQNIDAPCEFFINNKGTFQNITNQVGLGQIRGVVKGVTSGDINNDGWQDLYVSILGQPNRLFLNKSNGSNVFFEDITEKSGTQEPFESFPTWMWDYNNDGWLDIFAASYNITSQKAAETLASNYFGKSFSTFIPKVYQNNGDGTFTENSDKMGLTEPMFAMGSNYGDLDNDGFLDFYIGTGAPSFTSIVPNKMYRNNKGKTFQDVTTSGRFGHIQKGHAVSFGDLDNDGDQDIFHVLGGAYEGDVFGDALFENPVGNKKSWITISLEGTTSNKDAIGARIKITTEQKNGKEQVFYNVVSTGGSFGSSSLQQEIGLDNTNSIKEIEIKWPNSTQSVAVFKDVEMNRFVKITEGATTVEYVERPSFRFQQLQ